MGESFEKIDLLPEEEVLFAAIEFDALKLSGRPNDFESNVSRVKIMVQRLFDRKAIPEQRWKSYDDREHNWRSRKISVKQEYARRNVLGDDVYGCSDFLPILYYWVCGAKLDDVIRHAFWSAVKKCGGVTSGDVEALGKLARRLAKEHGLENYAAQEEFYKLALDCCVSPRYAADIGKAIRKSFAVL
ncbi:MAG: hypothetical protein ABL904_07785 [Hyphomicrobiaceae bacterium]